MTRNALDRQPNPSGMNPSKQLIVRIFHRYGHLAAIAPSPG